MSYTKDLYDSILKLAPCPAMQSTQLITAVLPHAPGPLHMAVLSPGMHFLHSSYQGNLIHTSKPSHSALLSPRDSSFLLFCAPPVLCTILYSSLLLACPTSTTCKLPQTQRLFLSRHPYLAQCPWTVVTQQCLLNEYRHGCVNSDKRIETTVTQVGGGHLV